MESFFHLGTKKEKRKSKDQNKNIGTFTSTIFYPGNGSQHLICKFNERERIINLQHCFQNWTGLGGRTIKTRNRIEIRFFKHRELGICGNFVNS